MYIADDVFGSWDQRGLWQGYVRGGAWWLGMVRWCMVWLNIAGAEMTTGGLSQGALGTSRVGSSRDGSQAWVAVLVVKTQGGAMGQSGDLRVGML